MNAAVHAARRGAFALALSLVGSSGIAQETQAEALGGVPLARVKLAFAELDEACARDGGRLWGRPLDPWVLLIDPATRRVAANRADPSGRLEAREGLFLGTLPREVPVANAPVEWDGRRWAMVMAAFLGETRAERVTLLAHESFHCLQPELGLYPFAPECVHLDTLEGRIGMQLEWNALQGALAASGEARRAAVADALSFRAARRARFPEAAERENAIELREGLANDTGQRLAQSSEAEVVAYAAGRRAREDGFARSFAYVSGPLYGSLLDGTDATDWRAGLDADSDLGRLLAQALSIVPDAARAAERAEAWGGAALRASEEARERQRMERLAAWRASLIEGPVLVLDLSQVTSGTMDTRKVHPFDEGRTVFTERVLQARWGRLEVHGGAILENSSTRLGRISLADAAADRCSGPGWMLEPAPGWTIRPGERAGDYALLPER